MATRRQRGAVWRIQVSRASSRAASPAAVPTCQHQGVDPFGPWGQRGSAQHETALGPDRGAPRGGEGDPVATRPPERGGCPTRAGEDFVGAHGIERLDALEGDDHDVTLLHGSHSAGQGGWRQ